MKDITIEQQLTQPSKKKSNKVFYTVLVFTILGIVLFNIAKSTFTC